MADFTLYLGRLETVVPVLGIAILRSAWVELDSIVQGVMWQPLLMFLKRMHLSSANHFKFS